MKKNQTVRLIMAAVGALAHVQDLQKKLSNEKALRQTAEVLNENLRNENARLKRLSNQDVYYCIYIPKFKRETYVRLVQQFQVFIRRFLVNIRDYCLLLRDIVWPSVDNETADADVKQKKTH